MVSIRLTRVAPGCVQASTQQIEVLDTTAFQDSMIYIRVPLPTMFVLIFGHG